MLKVAPLWTYNFCVKIFGSMNDIIKASLFFIFPAMIFGSCSETPAGLRVMSYNIRAAVESDLSEIADEIKSHHPDVVALQEVDVHWGERSSFADQAMNLAEMLGMYHFFGEIYNLPPTGDRSENRRYGMALLSKYPFQHRKNHSLARLSSLNESNSNSPVLMPGFPEVGINLDGQTVHIFNTHLDYRPDPALRRRQVGEILEIIRQKKGPVILMGDLNADPEDPEIGELFELFNDAWENGEGGGFTFPADDPQKRIDYILYTDHFEVTGVFVPNTQKSDHRPVIATLVLK